MKIKEMLLFLALSIFIISCGKNDYINGTDFDFDKMNDSIVSFEKKVEDLIYVEGNNICSSDYDIVDNNLIIKASYLANLNPGIKEYVVKTKSNVQIVKINIIDKNNIYKIINSSFETKDLTGWTAKTVFKNEDNILSFIESGIMENKTFSPIQINYNGEGNYVYGFEETQSWSEKLGILKSSNFVLGGSGFITFRIGGCPNKNVCYISIKRVETDEEIARFSNSLYNDVSYFVDPNEYRKENLVKYKADLSAYINENLYLEICDFGASQNDFITFDDFNMYNEIQPGNDYNLAENILPRFNDDVPSNNLYNGNFSHGINGWTILDNNIFTVDGNILKSNLKGDAGKGILRSSLFELAGSGIISLKLGAAQGQRWDKTTYIRVLEYKTNKEIIRFSNNRSNGNEMIQYYVDLSDYIGKYLYLEIVDNDINSWDVIFVSDIITYYKDVPEYDYSSSAINLNY